MAQAIQYTVNRPRVETNAREELERLLESCHEHDILRFLNDLVGANEAVTKTLVDGMKNEGALNAMQNICVLLMALSRIPPGTFYKLAFAAKDGFVALTEGDAQRSSPAPGVIGTYRMLHDENLWDAVRPFVTALQAFAQGLQRPVESPISDFAGKSVRGG